MKTKEYIENNKERFLEELFELLKIPSVSADPSFKEEVSKIILSLIHYQIFY